MAADLARLSRTTLNLLFEPGPSAPPLDDVAAAVGGRHPALHAIASALPAARGERLLRLGQRPVADSGRQAAAYRVVRGAFWYLVYELRPDLWDRLSTAERIAPQLLADLPADDARVVEVAAGSGRLTGAIAARAAWLLALEPCLPLRQILRQRHPGICVVAAVGHRLPVRTGLADLVVSCATFGPHPPLGGEAVRLELERCARSGGVVALVSPEEPAWWQTRGYEMRTYPAPDVQVDAELAAFFGPAHAPRRLLLKQVP